MPRQRLRLTETENQENRTRLARLEKMEILIGRAGDPSREPDRIIFEQADQEFARIYELPLDEVAVVVPAKMIVLNSGILITDVSMMTPWDDSPLDLWDPKESSYRKDLFGDLYESPPTLLNPWLEGSVPLRCRQVEGVIIAHGYISVPSQCHDETLVTLKLLLTDRRRSEFSFDFGVRVDRSVMRKCKRRQLELREVARRTKGAGLYEPKTRTTWRSEESLREGTIKHPHASSKHDTTCDASTPETQLGGQ